MCHTGCLINPKCLNLLAVILMTASNVRLIDKIHVNCFSDSPKIVLFYNLFGFWLNAMPDRTFKQNRLKQYYETHISTKPPQKGK